MTAMHIDRRSFLANSGLAGIALTWMLHRDGFGSEHGQPNVGPHFVPRAKNVIWLFMVGGTSHLESFDPKPALNRYAGLSIDETPHADVLNSPFLKNERDLFENLQRERRTVLYPMQVGFQQRGSCGLEISDWWPHVGSCADDLCVIRSLWTEDIDHGAQLQFHTGRHRNDGFFPTIGSWVTYGLGTLNANLPEFIVLGVPPADCCGGREAHRANYLGPAYDGVPLNIEGADATPYIAPAEGVFVEEQRAEFDLLGRLNQMTAARFPDDDRIRARMASYDLAFRMQAAVPEAVRLANETAPTQQSYGLDDPMTKPFAEQLLTARRLVERGVRFVQVYHGSNGGAGAWDAHSQLKAGHERVCRQVDRPIGALLRDLKQRGLLEETLIVWATEFGRTPGSQGADGRDHHPFGFSVWMAGGGIKGGVAHGATDELGFHAVEHRHYVTDVHATVLHQLGLDSRRMELSSRKRLARDHGEPIQQIIS
ncbi:MAG: DUF1501 domain-containing protein [Planctomycetaceae bacterium]